jgi:hypothetical protein
MTEVLSILQLRKNPQRIESLFFDAMRNGYVGDEPPTIVPLLPCGKQTVLKHTPWLVTDTWEKNEWTNYSGGATRIYYDGTLVWMMQYFGAYAPEVIPFLKQALFEHYQGEKFYGGRGPKRFTHENIEYTNEVEHGSSFQNFRGIEKIHREGMLLGEHRYHGGLMI